MCNGLTTCLHRKSRSTVDTLDSIETLSEQHTGHALVSLEQGSYCQQGFWDFAGLSEIHLLPAEGSAKVTQEPQHSRPLHQVCG